MVVWTNGDFHFLLISTNNLLQLFHENGHFPRGFQISKAFISVEHFIKYMKCGIINETSPNWIIPYYQLYFFNFPFKTWVAWLIGCLHCDQEVAHPIPFNLRSPWFLSGWGNIHVTLTEIYGVEVGGILRLLSPALPDLNLRLNHWPPVTTAAQCEVYYAFIIKKLPRLYSSNQTYSNLT